MKITDCPSILITAYLDNKKTYNDILAEYYVRLGNFFKQPHCNMSLAQSDIFATLCTELYQLKQCAPICYNYFLDKFKVTFGLENFAVLESSLNKHATEDPTLSTSTSSTSSTSTEPPTTTTQSTGPQEDTTRKMSISNLLC